MPNARSPRSSSMTSIVCALGLLAMVGCSLDTSAADVMKGHESGGQSDDDPTLFGFEGGAARLKKRVTGADLDTSQRWAVAGTDLGIPYVLENGSIGYLFGDTFNTASPSGPLPNDWRSPVMLRSSVHPGDPGGIVFDSAAKVSGNGRAPDIFYNAKTPSKAPGAEWTVIPNDGISFPETGRQVISFMSIHDWDTNANSNWRTNYASLAYSDNGNDFTRVPYLGWENNADNTDPFQMWTMQRDGDYVYVYSVRAGRQQGPMMLRRVRWDKLFYKEAYECWSGGADRTAHWGGDCAPLLNGRFGEPSVRRLKSGTWAMAYLNVFKSSIVTRTAPSPTGPWSEEKSQVNGIFQEQGLYGGFIHPWSDTGKDNLHIMVSKWFGDQYHVSQYVSTL